VIKIGEEMISGKKVVNDVRTEAYNFGELQYYFTRTLVDKLGEFRGKQIYRDSVYAFACERGMNLRKKAEALGLAPTQENWRKVTDIPFIAWVGKEGVKGYQCPYGWAWLEKAKEDPEALDFGFLYCLVNDPTVANTFNPKTEQLTFTRHVLWGDEYCGRITESEGVVVTDTIKERNEYIKKTGGPPPIRQIKDVTVQEYNKNLQQMAAHVANVYFHMCNTIIDQLGRIMGEEIIREAVKKFAVDKGKKFREKATELGLEPTYENFEKVSEIAPVGWGKSPCYCPYVDVWNEKGVFAREMGMIYCNVFDSNMFKTFNPELKNMKLEKHPLKGDDTCERVFE
jgi:hypothetical protein